MASRAAALAIVWCLAASAALGAEAAADPSARGQCWAVIVGAMPGEPLFARHYRDWILRFHTFLVREAGVPADNITVLSGDKDFSGPPKPLPATAESVVLAIADLASKVRPQDQVILFIVGHGVLTDQVPTLVLPGPDVTARQLAGALAGLSARNQVVLHLSSSGGAAVPHLVAKGRVVVTATSATEGNEPVFPEFFLRGLESKRADGEGAPAAGSRDGVVTLLEAYNWATHQTALWISRFQKVDGGWRIDGKESVEIFHKLYGKDAGAPSPFTLVAADDSKPDAVVPLAPEGGKIDQSWLSRRVLSEHALLEDCGEKDGVAAVRNEGYQPLAGRQEGEPGYLARRVVLGRAELLSAP